MLITDGLQHSHHCVGQGASEASSLTYLNEVSYKLEEMKGLTSFKSPSIYLTKEGQNWRIDQFKFNLKYIDGKDMEVIKILIDYGFDVNLQGLSNGYTRYMMRSGRIILKQ